MTTSHYAWLLMGALLFAPGIAVGADAEHEEMHEEHQKDVADHQKWMTQIGKMRIQHKEALAALAMLEAEILAHDAELEEMAEEIRVHAEHIAEHEEELDSHDEDSHDKLEKSHEKLQAEHAAVGKKLTEMEKDHDDLIDGLLKFVKKHLSKFHEHSHD
ncbi:hypothetical protein [Blastopirellula retiformator]|uniref:Chromosome partition protein Smc n=1 Tax=Blastopirellula retiformator TaxID=2527970 RepID=A0A5C5V9Q6_9BACT|nr:hypothetical protein [Blastopirellula retiformator]TWT34607.1 Chromosome partition protein Smc [Blastopirellula retiformator]